MKWVTRFLLTVVGAIAIGVVVAGLIGCGSGGGGSSSAATGASAATEGTNATTTGNVIASGSCKQVKAPKPKRINLKKPAQTVQKGEKLTAVVETSCGTFEIALDTTRAPKTTNSFAYLAEEGFYNGLPFYNIVPKSLIQGGDPLANGFGGPGYRVDEKPPPNVSYTKGTVVMPHASGDPPGRSGSRFVVFTSTEPPAVTDLALLGKVSEGYEAVARIEQQGTELDGPNPVLIEKITIDRG
jgi:peptidyl-prolyl cis-trans isomerase B (cyclophilin B)